ncbi:hypothetical protein GCM10023196_105630 [Actinoallomurus vinaceus]|uniref:SH3b domain-containing protein n=1 Tax=Actinoallomurus vinaceus TaxID=1080074 RepID=A0ABP8UVY1_9ACTN
MRIARAATTIGAAACLSFTIGATPSFADATSAAKPHAAVSKSASAQAVKCHVYTDKKRGYKYTVRTKPRTSAKAIVVYKGKKLLGWKTGYKCPQVTGGSYRCAVGEPKDNQWLIVNYKGRKGYVADRCSGGIGA